MLFVTTPDTRYLGLIFTLLINPFAADGQAQSSDPPPESTTNSFVEGKVEKLKAKWKSAKPIGNENALSLAEVEVQNKGRITAEPLSFFLSPASRDLPPFEIHRVETPFFARAGRPIRPGGKQIYRLVVPHPAKQLRRLSIRVEHASFLDDQTLTDWVEERAKAMDEAISIGKLRHSREMDPSRGRPLDRTGIPLRNRLRCPIDVVLEVTYREPVQAKTLLTTRLEGEETKELLVKEFGSVFNYQQMKPGAKITRAEVVDWAFVFPSQKAASGMIESVFQSWWRLPQDVFPLTFEFDYEIDATSIRGETFSVNCTGTLEIPLEGEAKIQCQANLRGLALKELQGLSSELVEAIRHPLIGEGLATYKMERVSGGPRPWFRVDPDPFGRSAQPTYFEIEENRVVTVGRQPFHPSLPNRWITEESGDRWRLIRREEQRTNVHPDPESYLKIDWKGRGEKSHPQSISRKWNEHLGQAKGTSSLTLEIKQP